MSAPIAPPSNHSILHPAHQALRPKFGEFGGWEMPIYYTSIMKEHQAVRTTCGIFDVSHLAQVRVSGPEALNFLQQLMTQDIARLKSGQATYTPMCNEQGGIVDEMIIYRLGEQEFLPVVNAGNVEKDLRWMQERGKGGVQIQDCRFTRGIIAVQGPLSLSIAEKMADRPLRDIQYYHCVPGRILGRPAVIARTGYTGEDGFEWMMDNTDLPPVWDKALELTKQVGGLPAGLGARDTLRLEAGMPLYGNDIDDNTSPFEIGIGRTVQFSKLEFIGRTALWRQSQEGLRRRLIGFSMEEAGVPRHGYALAWKDKPVGVVTSGTYSPTLKRNIGLGFVTPEAGQPGTTLSVVIHQRPTRATVVKLPFYKHHGKS
ncbi:MAG: glycine cleavage system aminomethyltransferase GcvT [Candidatus Omnitrophica bacterium]|nr:glycine cleavage system aminomethyltransferase GcvT [Candidatus Omnitrophota bacterium]